MSESMFGPPDRVLNKTINLWRTKNGDYLDEQGTIYPAVLFDDHRVGLDKIWATRFDDPYREKMAVPHDHATEALEAGYASKDATALSVSNELAVNGASVMYNEGVRPLVYGLTNIVKGLVYIPIGYVIGGILYAVKARKK